MDLEEETKKLTKRAKRIEIDDGDLGNWNAVLSTFPEHLQVVESGTFISPISSKSTRKPSASLVSLYSELTSTEDSLVCGLTNGEIRIISPSDLSTSVTDSSKLGRLHNGLSCIRCSKTNPNGFFSSSDIDGTIQQWDIRENPSKVAQKFCLSSGVLLGSGGESSGSTVKPILSFDISSTDQIICGGTELQGEDSYLLFWDVRSTKLLGAYWESHSDDVTAVKFHPTQTHSLASGSTDGLLNIFNLLETEEDDALLFSFNTESSVDSIHWSNDNFNSTSSTTIVGITHTNDLHIWNTESGDQVTSFTRKNIAESMMRSNPDAVHVNGCYQTLKGSTGVLACSLSGDCARFLDISGTEMVPRSLFLEQSAVIQTAQFLAKNDCWITLDEEGYVKLWKSNSKPAFPTPDETHIIKGGGKKKRFQPYCRDKSQKNK